MGYDGIFYLVVCYGIFLTFFYEKLKVFFYKGGYFLIFFFFKMEEVFS